MSKQSMNLHVQGELDELEREEFFRLKKVQAKKKRDATEKDQAVIQVGTAEFPATLPHPSVNGCVLWHSRIDCEMHASMLLRDWEQHIPRSGHT